MTFFWQIGKIHGIENTALCSVEDLKKTGGDPMAIQRLVNAANDAKKPDGPGSFENAVQDLQSSLADYQQSVDKFGG